MTQPHASTMAGHGSRLLSVSVTNFSRSACFNFVVAIRGASQTGRQSQQGSPPVRLVRWSHAIRSCHDPGKPTGSVGWECESEKPTERTIQPKKKATQRAVEKPGSVGLCQVVVTAIAGLKAERGCCTHAIQLRARFARTYRNLHALCRRTPCVSPQSSHADVRFESGLLGARGHGFGRPVYADAAVTAAVRLTCISTRAIVAAPFRKPHATHARNHSLAVHGLCASPSSQ